MSHRLSVALIVLAATAAGCKKAQSGGANARGPAGMPPMPVEVSPAIKDTVVDAVAATGGTEPVQRIEVHPEATGRITDILVNEGQEVAKGAPLFKVDDAELKAQVDQADAERELARQALERTKSLIAQNASSAADLEQAQARSQAANASYELLKTRLDRTLVRGPASREHRHVRDAAELAHHAAVGEPAAGHVPGAGAVCRPLAPRAARELPGGRAAGGELLGWGSVRRSRRRTRPHHRRY